MRPTGRSTGRGACRPSCVSATASTCRASASSAVCEGPSSRACRTKAWAHDDPGARRSRRRRPRQAPVPSRCTGRPLGRRHHLPAHLAGVGSISLPSRTPTAGGSLAGAWPITCAQSSSSTRCRWPCTAADRALVWSIISEQGSQFVSLAFGPQARDAGIAVSMGSRGDCFDNAVAESFLATLKKGARSPPKLADPPRADERGLRVRRSLLQHDPPALDPGLPLTHPVRGHDHDQQPQRDRLAPQAPTCPKNRVDSTGMNTQGQNPAIEVSVRPSLAPSNWAIAANRVSSVRGTVSVPRRSRSWLIAERRLV
ncbi:MAG: family transposase [Acidimicrobiales bacterium]|nr:family transposase [Acidimicrobiales bacterium]